MRYALTEWRERYLSEFPYEKRIDTIISREENRMKMETERTRI